MSIIKELSVIISELQDAIDMQEVEIKGLNNQLANCRWENRRLREQNDGLKDRLNKIEEAYAPYQPSAIRHSEE